MDSQPGNANEPTAPPQLPRAKRYLRIDSRKITFREYWNITRSGKVIIPWVAKLLGIRMDFSSGLPYFDSVRELKVAQENFPKDAFEALLPQWHECHALGFTWAQFYVYGNMQGDTRVSSIALFHPSGATVRLMHTQIAKVQPPKVKQTVGLLSQLADGTFFYTSGQREQFENGPETIINRLVGASLEQMIRSHLQKLGEFQSTNPARRVDSVDALDDLWDRYEHHARDFGFQRGLYVVMTPEEVGTAQSHVTEAQSMAGAATENLPVLIELAKLQNRKSSWTTVIGILVISLGLFIGAGSRQWSTQYVLILVPVLFVHELGHYLAMRVFHYRNLRMFFIPLFGAAVSGSHFNIPGWKKVIVSLMGPVPGIVLGIMCGGAGLILHQALLTKIAIVTLILNGFNLLPVLPFDGGWVVHTLLFSRHYMWDAVFRVLAALALIAIAILSRSKYLAYVSIPMLLSIPVSYRMAKAAAALRARGVSPASADSQTVPPETAQAIITELRQVNTNTKLTTNKILAQQTLQVFETLNARPPGWPGTIGFLLVQFGSLGMAAIFAMVFIVFQRSDFRGVMTDALMGQQPKHKLECNHFSSWPAGPAVINFTNPRNTLVATFASSREAGSFFQNSTNHLPPDAAWTQFGDTLLLSLPVEADAARKDWLADFQQKTSDVFVANTNFPATIAVVFTAPGAQAAETITNELSGYFLALFDAHLVPPWAAGDQRTAEQRSRDQLARHTYALLVNSQYDNYTSPEQKALRKRLAAASRQGDQAAVKALTEEMRQDSQKLRRRNVEKIRNGERGPVDTNIVEMFLGLIKEDRDPEDEAPSPIYKDLARHMGQLPMVEGKIAPGADRFSSSGGFVMAKGLEIHLPFMTFSEVDAGAPAFAQWLCDKGCTDIKYQFHGAGGAGELDRD